MQQKRRGAVCRTRAARSSGMAERNETSSCGPQSEEREKNKGQSGLDTRVV